MSDASFAYLACVYYDYLYVCKFTKYRILSMKLKERPVLKSVEMHAGVAVDRVMRWGLVIDRGWPPTNNYHIIEDQSRH